MYYIFNKNGDCVCSADYEVDKDDLTSRDEIAVESKENYDIQQVKLVDGAIVIVEPPAPTAEEIQKMLTDGVQAYMDTKAQERGYDNIHTACSYANSTDEVFKAEGTACLAWRDSVWRKCYNILDEVKAGKRAIPTLEEVIAELPVLVW